MINKFQNLLIEDEFYKNRQDNSNQKIVELQKELKNNFNEFNISIFIVGSISRNEIGKNSDLDLFIISKEDISKLEQYKIFAKLIEINKKLNFPEFSNDGKFLKIHKLDNLKNFTVFSTVIAIIIKKDIDHDDILKICNKTPLERISWSLDTIADKSLLDDFKNILSYYQVFLKAKENENIEKDDSIKEQLNFNADKFSDILFNILNHKNIDNTLKKNLII